MNHTPLIGALAVAFVSAGTVYWMLTTGRLRRLMTRKSALEDGIIVEGDGRSIRTGKWHKVQNGRNGPVSDTASTISALTGYNSTLRDETSSDDENSEGWSSIDSRSECASHSGGGNTAVGGLVETNLRNHVDDDDPTR